MYIFVFRVIKFVWHIKLTVCHKYFVLKKIKKYFFSFYYYSYNTRQNTFINIISNKCLCFVFFSYLNFFVLFLGYYPMANNKWGHWQTYQIKFLHNLQFISNLNRSIKVITYKTSFKGFPFKKFWRTANIIEKLPEVPINSNNSIFKLKIWKIIIR